MFGKRFLWLVVCPVALWAQLPSEYDNCPAAVMTAVNQMVTQYGLPGAQIAVAQNGQLRCAGALGYADAATKRAMRPTTLMRVGSISKPITGMAILRLVEDGKITLDDPIVKYFSDLLPSGGPADSRWNRVTIRNLMQHSMGWDRAVGGEPIQSSRNISRALGIRGPATSTDMARWLFTQRLHFDPGAHDSYTGAAYALASVIVERVSGMPYERFVRSQVLEPLGIRVSMRIGRTLQEGRAFPDDPARLEASYDPPAAPVPSVFPYITGNVPAPYGEFYTESMEGSGGWTATAPALVRFVDRIMGRGGPAFFKQSTIDLMTAKPTYEAASATSWYGIGWQIVQAAAGFRLRFAGALRGTTGEIYHLPNGNTYAFITNSSGNDPDFSNLLSNYLFQNLSGLPGIGGADLYANAKYVEPENNTPVIRSQKNVVQGASLEPGITSGSWFTIFGWNLATTTRIWEGRDFVGNTLPTKLDGVEVKINGRSAAVYFISPTQINAQVPGGLQPGTATLQVIRDGIASQPEPVEIRERSPESFRYFVGGKSFAAALHVDGAIVGDPDAVPGTRAAQPGQTLQVFGTGFAVSPDGVIVNGATTITGASATVGDRPATVAFAGLVATGLFQVNIVVPQLPSGDYPLRLTIDGVQSLVPATIPVR